MNFLKKLLRYQLARNVVAKHVPQAHKPVEIIASIVVTLATNEVVVLAKAANFQK